MVLLVKMKNSRGNTNVIFFFILSYLFSFLLFFFYFAGFLWKDKI